MRIPIIESKIAEGPEVEYETHAPLTSARAVFELTKAMGILDMPSEQFWAFALDGKHRLVGAILVSQGTLTSSLVHPREVFGPAMRTAPCAAIVVVHNHPSGDPEPSPEDLEVTRRLAESGKLLGVPLLDHVVVGREGFRSLREMVDLG